MLSSRFAMRATRKAWPLLVLVAEVLAFFRHILFYGHYASPWDFRTYRLSQAWFIARSFARNELPLWDPYTYCGMPVQGHGCELMSLRKHEWCDPHR